MENSAGILIPFERLVCESGRRQELPLTAESHNPREYYAYVSWFRRCRRDGSFINRHATRTRGL